MKKLFLFSLLIFSFSLFPNSSSAGDYSCGYMSTSDSCTTNGLPMCYIGNDGQSFPDIYGCYSVCGCTYVEENNASCTSLTAPTSVTAGSTFGASVTMYNSGDKTWSPSANYNLGAYNLGSNPPTENWTWGTNRIASPATVAPNNSTTINFNSTATATPGTYPFTWRMVQDGVEWFGASCSQNITVVAPIIPVCATTHYTCNAGTSASNAEASPNWTWTCNSPNGGGSVSCSESMPLPTTLSSSCSVLGTTGSFSWALPTGYTLSYFRIWDTTTNTQVWGYIPENVSDTGPATSVTTIPGHTYSWWVHTRLPSGAWSNAVTRTLVCPAYNEPIGAFDSATCGANGITGWACDRDNGNTSIDVHIYNGVAVAPWTNNIGVITSNQVRRSDADPSCGGTASHGFAYSLPTSLKDGTNHTIHIYGINIGPTGTNNIDIGSKVINCPAPAVPTLSTPTHSSVTQTSATLGATVTSGGTSAVTARGTCWGTSAAPSTNCLAEGGTGVSAFTHSRSGFTAGTTYYYRGYATNAVGTGYSSDRTFVALANVPGVITVTPQACGTGQNFLDWPDATGATSYSIYSSTGVWIANSIGSNYTHTGSLSTAYSYYVRSNNSDTPGAQSANSAVSSGTTADACFCNARVVGTNCNVFKKNVGETSTGVCISTHEGSCSYTCLAGDIWTPVSNSCTLIPPPPEITAPAYGPHKRIMVPYPTAVTLHLALNTATGCTLTKVPLSKPKATPIPIPPVINSNIDKTVTVTANSIYTLTCGTKSDTFIIEILSGEYES